MNIFHQKRQKYRFFCWASCAFILLLIGTIPLRLAIAPPFLTKQGKQGEKKGGL